jgi:8-oxo-dGTP pyrophosphatase MutT (NUDIX family)
MERGALSIPAHAEHYSVVLLKERGSGNFLVQRRGKGDGVVYPGRLGLFGGRQEPGESAENCALREIEEEAGLQLDPANISLLARLLAHDEFGNLSFGHIFFAEDLDRAQVNAALRHRCHEGEVLLLRRADIGARWRQLTPITGYAFGTLFDFQSTSQNPGSGIIQRLLSLRIS